MALRVILDACGSSLTSRRSGGRPSVSDRSEFRPSKRPPLTLTLSP